MNSLGSILSHYGYSLLLLGVLLEGEAVVVLAGVFVHQGALAYSWSVLVAAIGAVGGDQMWFQLGRRLGPRLWTRYPWIARRMDAGRPWIEEKGDWVAVASRFTYGARIATPLLLGSARVCGHSLSGDQRYNRDRVGRLGDLGRVRPRNCCRGARRRSGSAGVAGARCADRNLRVATPTPREVPARNRSVRRLNEPKQPSPLSRIIAFARRSGAQCPATVAQFAEW